MPDERAERMYTTEELEIALRKATKAESRMTACESDVGHVKEELKGLRTDLNTGLSGIRAIIQGRSNHFPWKRPTVVVAGSGLIGVGWLINWLVEFLRGI